MVNKKWFLLLGALLALKCSISRGDAIHVVSKEAGIDITTTKIAHLTDVVDFLSKQVFDQEVASTISIAGPRVVIIDSPGGRVDAGNDMIETMELVRARGVKYICVTNHNAHSMAFNFLTHCDVRLATADSQFVVHKIAYGGIEPGTRLTAKALKELADQLEEMDEVFRQLNSKVMHLTLKQYDTYADAQRMWSAATLYFTGYLHGIATIEDASPSL